MRCLACGLENLSDARYCGDCGVELSASIACAGCGHPNAPRRNFCDHCGTSLSQGPEVCAEPRPTFPDERGSLGGGRYRITRFLGRGARKTVHLARDTRIDRNVAVATISKHGLDEHDLARARREARALGQLGDHAGIVTIYDVVEDANRVSLVCQYMPGGDLAQRLRQAEGHRLSLGDALRFGEEICRGLEHIHARGIVHRDLKPENVFIGDDGSPKIGDFGLALTAERSGSTEEGALIGTAMYMSPEQALGRLVDARGDLYAFGAILYEMLTGSGKERGT